MVVVVVVFVVVGGVWEYCFSILKCCGLILGVEREGGRARARAHRWAAARTPLSHQIWCERRYRSKFWCDRQLVARFTHEIIRSSVKLTSKKITHTTMWCRLVLDPDKLWLDFTFYRCILPLPLVDDSRVGNCLWFDEREERMLLLVCKEG